MPSSHTPGSQDAPDTPINLRHARLRRGKSIAQMAKEIGVSATSLERAEAGRNLLPENQLKIAQAYGLDVITQWHSIEDDKEVT